MSALRVLQVAGVLMALVGVAQVFGGSGDYSTVLGSLQVLAGLGMIIGARMEEHRRKE